MKTYAESQGKEAFNWNDFVNKTAFTQDELDDASQQAGNWVTGACGNLCESIPRDVHGVPADEDLKNLDNKFYQAIIEAELSRSMGNSVILLQDISKAKELLAQIQYRSLTLLKEILG